MKRVATKAILLAVLALLALGGAAQAFTPVPIPKPRAVSFAPTYIEHSQDLAITRAVT
jgi:hypothetical protein